MQIKVDDENLFALSELQKNIIKDNVSSVIFEDDMKDRFKYVIARAYEQAYKALRSHWEPILIADGAEDLPADKIEFAALVFAHEDYKDYDARQSA